MEHGEGRIHGNGAVSRGYGMRESPRCSGTFRKVTVSTFYLASQRREDFPGMIRPVFLDLWPQTPHAEMNTKASCQSSSGLSRNVRVWKKTGLSFCGVETTGFRNAESCLCPEHWARG